MKSIVDRTKTFFAFPANRSFFSHAFPFLISCHSFLVSFIVAAVESRAGARALNLAKTRGSEIPEGLLSPEPALPELYISWASEERPKKEETESEAKEPERPKEETEPEEKELDK